MSEKKKILEQKISECYTSPLKEYIIALLKPAIKLKSIISDTEINSINKIGGIPWLKKGEEWPRSKDGEPFLFLLQIDLEELAPFDIEKKLPLNGILSFYFSSTNWEEGLVIYYEDKKDLVQAELPNEYHKEQARKKLPMWKRLFKKRNHFQLYKACKLEFSVEYQKPGYDSVQIRMFLKEHSSKHFEFIIDDKKYDKVFFDKPIVQGNHHLLGYYDDLQGPYELQNPTNWLQFTGASKQQLQEANEWIVLLVLDADELTDMIWIDGQLLFFIHREDLANKKFDRIQAFLDTT